MTNLIDHMLESHNFRSKNVEHTRMEDVRQLVDDLKFERVHLSNARSQKRHYDEVKFVEHQVRLLLATIQKVQLDVEHFQSVLHNITIAKKNPLKRANKQPLHELQKLQEEIGSRLQVRQEGAIIILANTATSFQQLLERHAAAAMTRYEEEEKQAKEQTGAAANSSYNIPLRTSTTSAPSSLVGRRSLSPASKRQSKLAARDGAGASSPVSNLSNSNHERRRAMMTKSNSSSAFDRRRAMMARASSVSNLYTNTNPDSNTNTNTNNTTATDIRKVMLGMSQSFSNLNSNILSSSNHGEKRRMLKGNKGSATANASFNLLASPPSSPDTIDKANANATFSASCVNFSTEDTAIDQFYGRREGLLPRGRSATTRSSTRMSTSSSVVPPTP